MGTFAALKYINAEHGGFAGAPAVAVIDAEASAVSLANRLQPLGVTSTNHNIIMLGEGVCHFGVRARSAATTLTTLPSVNIYRLYGPAESFTSTTLANDGTIHFDVVNHSQVYSTVAATNGYLETIQAYAFTAAIATSAVTNAKRDGSYTYTDWAIGDRGSYVYQDAGSVLFAGADRSWVIPSYGARAVLVFHSVAANVSGGAGTCDVLVYPFAKGNSA